LSVVAVLAALLLVVAVAPEDIFTSQMRTFRQEPRP
jgi:hypothetical protein